MIGEYAGFVQGGNRDSGGAQSQLTLGDLDALVGLDVRAERDAELTRPVGHPPQVGFEHVHIQKKSRSRQVVQSHGAVLL